MKTESISAYDLQERVAGYDADMDIMHPNRKKMVEIAIATLPFSPEVSLKVIDLGVGTGYFTERFLEAYPGARVTAIDGAPQMVQLAQSRLQRFTEPFKFLVSDFRNLRKMIPGTGSVDVVYSSYALHHLDRTDKTSVVRQSLQLLKTGGWFLNADVIIADFPDLEHRIQTLRVEGIVRRAGGSDTRFSDSGSTRAFLDNLEEREKDQPLRLSDDLSILKEAGFTKCGVLWVEYREAVLCGIK